MKSTTAVLLCLALLSCTSRKEPVPEPDTSGRTSLWPSEPGHSTELAGNAVSESKSGPWTVRRAGAGSRGRSGRLAAGDDMAPGAAAPMESVEMESGGEGGGAGGAFGGRPSGAPKGDTSGEDSFDGGAEPDPSGPWAEDRQGGGSLRAGATDDNEEFEAFLEFLATWSDREDTAGQYDLLDVADRRSIRVLNRQGKPVPSAVVTLVDEGADRIVFRGTTYGDGRVPFYADVALAEGTAATAAEGADAGLLVEVEADGKRSRVRWKIDTPELVVSVDAALPVKDPIRLDVLFLIDTTGSMGDEIGRIKASLLGVTEKLRGLDREFDLHYAAVLYRDIGDAYVTKSHPFTDDIAAFDQALQSVAAAGGGDGPESLNQGLAEAVGREDWRPGAAKVMFLIADASPHMDYQGDIRYGETVKAAVARGIKIHSVAASGLDPLGTFVFRQIAQFTRGKFIFIQYGTMAATAESHGVAGAVKSNNLDDILFEQIRDEIATWGR